MQMSSPDSGSLTGAELRACEGSIRRGSRSFFAASLLLPRRISRPAAVLYSFCRSADDLIDVDRGGADAVSQLRDRLARIYQGHPLPVGPDRAFSQLVAAFAIPRQLPEALLEGLEWDAAGRRYETLTDLKLYAARVAGSVGAMMAIIMGASSEEAVARACDLGVAMQLTNIARDVGEDARQGRIYLPLEWLRQADVKPESWLARPAFAQSIGYAVQRLLRSADLLYQRADAGILLLPRPCRPGVRAARLLYAEIGREVARADFDSVTRRAIVPARRKASLLAQGLFGRTVQQADDRRRFAVAPESRVLVQAVAAGFTTDAAAAAGASPSAVGRVEDRVAWLVDLFERLERRQQLQGPQ